MPDEPWTEQLYTAFFERPFPSDLKIASMWLTVSILAIYLPVLNTSPLRVLLTLPMILFWPGYCLIAALFPRNSDIDLIERFALSFGLSIAVAPLIGLGLNFTPWGIRLEPIVVSLTLFTLAMIVVAHYRRVFLPAEERFRIPFSERAAEIRHAVSVRGGSRVDRILNVVLILAVLTAIVTTVYVIAVPKQGKRFTEFYILGEGQKAADYPDRISVGEHYPLYIGVGNHEYRTVTLLISLVVFCRLSGRVRIMCIVPVFR